MKLLIVMLAVVACVAAKHSDFSKESLVKLNVLKEQCLPKTGAAPDVLDRFIVGDFAISDRPTKCFAKCFYQKSGIFDKNDNLDVKGSIAAVGGDYGAENVKKWLAPCKSIDHKDPCEKAFEIIKCFHKQKQSKA